MVQEKMTKAGCSLCLFEEIEDYEQDYIHKRSTVAEIVESLKVDGVDVSRTKFYNHIQHHLKTEAALIYSKNAEVLSAEFVDKQKELIDNMEKMRDKMEAIEHVINSESDPSMIKAYVSLASELRKTIEVIAKLQGEFSSSQHVHVNTMNVEYNNVVAQILQDACPQCKVKFAKTLEPILKL